MQLLQKLRDSHSLRKVAGEVAELEKQARVFSNSIAEFLAQVSGKVLVCAYTGFGSIPASVVYWYTTVTGRQNAVLMSLESATTFVLPYRDDVSVLVFSTGEYSRLFASLQAVRVLGVDYRAYAPQPLDERLKLLAKHYGVELFPQSDVYASALLLSFASFIALTGLYKDVLQARGKRLLSHSTEGFTAVAESLVEKYSPLISRVAELESPVLTSSELLEPSAQLFALALAEAGLNTTYMPLSLILEKASEVGKPLVAIYTSAEEASFKELRSTRKGLLEIVFNTDPLEAGIYLTMISLFITRLSN
ncbi:MAG: hypothetical protein ACP5KA_01890 [Desulfurococcaceae archaeon]